MNNELEPKDDGHIVVTILFFVILFICFGAAHAHPGPEAHPHDRPLTDEEMVLWEATAKEIAKCSGMLRGLAFLTESPRVKFQSDGIYTQAVKFFMVSGHTEYEAIYSAKKEQAMYSNWMQMHSNAPSMTYLLASKYTEECREIELMLKDLND